MTREEAKEILSGYVKACKEDDFHTLEMFEYEEVIEAMTMGAKALSIPSLPSDLNEEALKAYPKMSRLSEPHGVIPADNKTHYLGDANEENRAAFKAGVEWMAEQGMSCEAEVVKDVGISFLKEPFEKAAKEFDGKVIVQIRKK